MRKVIIKTAQAVRTKFQELHLEYKKAGTLGIPLGLRTFLFLGVHVLIMLLCVVVLLLFTGTFSVRQIENEKLVQSELSYLSQRVSEHFGGLSVQAVDLSKGMAESIEKSLNSLDLKVTDLPNHPEILESIIGNEYQRMMFSLQKTQSSGVFLIMDATVNPNLKNAQFSKAGLYIKNMEPNIISVSSPTTVILRGFPNIARKNAQSLHAQWSMEFDVSDAPYFRLPIQKAMQKDLPLSRLYYWSPALTLPETSEKVMLCSVPLIDSSGNVFGVCGFEISAMLFKLAHHPNNSNYSRIFCMMAPIKNNEFNTSEAMFSGSYSALNNKLTDNTLLITENKNLNTYYQQGGTVFLGLHQTISFYPKGSPFLDNKWAISLLIPQEDIRTVTYRNNMQLALYCIILIIVGIILSSLISKRYIKPIRQGLAMIKSNDFTDVPKVKIPEIDDLIKFLSANNKKKPGNPSVELSDTVFEEFIRNTKTLSPAERAVFDLYVQGHTAKEITQILHLSINTIKTHNKRIYMKLDVASREDLLVYVTKLKQLENKLL